MRKKFEFIDHTADIGIVAYGADLKESFANAALALFSLIAELDNVSEGFRQELEVTAEDEEGLLVQWLNELIYLFDVEHLIFRRFEIVDFTPTRLRAICYGERVDPLRHKLKTGVKAATYHMLKVDKSGDHKVQVILDI